MAEQSNERTQDPTPHRRQQARQEGQVAKSQDLVSAALLFGGVLFLLLFGVEIVELMGRLTQRHLGGPPWLEVDPQWFYAQWTGHVRVIGGGVLPLLATLWALALCFSVMQTGWVFVPKRLAPDVKRIDPLKGLGRIFSMSNVVRLGFGLFKVAVVGGVALWSLYDQTPTIAALAMASVPQVALFVTQILLQTTLKIGLALLVLALLDFAFQRWKYERDLKMTSQEIRDEMKQLQGDPQVLARRRTVQRQLVMHRLANEVPKADVVVTNPTELAVALQYDPQKMKAPIVVAKGAGLLAQRIRRLALEHGIPIVERKPLAQALYKQVQVRHPVPHEWYAAVAEVLAYVYQLTGRQVPPGRAAS